MTFTTNLQGRLSGLLLLPLALSACGGNSGGESTGSSVDAVVNPQGGDNAPQTIAVGEAISAIVANDTYSLYQVPSSSQVVLSVDSGIARLSLYTSLDLEDDSLVCSARRGLGESACSATVSDGELYALVYGGTDASYTISADTDCSVEAINGWVDRNMRDYYLYADQVPSVNPGSYDSPEALLADLRFNTLNPYSSARDAQSQSNFSDQGITNGLGLIWRRDFEDVARVSMVYDNSPFGRADVKRGDIIVAVNGELWEQLTVERYYELIDTSDTPLSTTWTFIDNDTGEQINIVVQPEEFTVNTVLHSNCLREN